VKFRRYDRGQTHTHTHTHTDRQTDRQTDRHAHRWTWTNLIHDFTVVTFSVKLAFFREKTLISVKSVIFL